MCRAEPKGARAVIACSMKPAEMRVFNCNRAPDAEDGSCNLNTTMTTLAAPVFSESLPYLTRALAHDLWVSSVATGEALRERDAEPITVLSEAEAEEREFTALHATTEKAKASSEVLAALGYEVVAVRRARSEVKGWSGDKGHAVIESAVIIVRPRAGEQRDYERDALSVLICPGNKEGWTPMISVSRDLSEIRAHAVLWDDHSTSDAEMFDIIETKFID